MLSGYMLLHKVSQGPGYEEPMWTCIKWSVKLPLRIFSSINLCEPIKDQSKFQEDEYPSHARQALNASN